MLVPSSTNQTSNSEPRVRTEVRSVLGWPSNTFAIDYYGRRRRSRSEQLQGSIADTTSFDALPDFPHTVLVFVPGNPGLVEWYIASFTEIVGQLGPGYAARGISNAGHGITENLVESECEDGTEQEQDIGRKRPAREGCIPWTIDGQVLHKIAYMEMLDEELGQLVLSSNHDDSIQLSPGRLPRYVLVSHSLGAHFTQRICMLRPDLLRRTKLLLHVTPFLRMKAPWSKQVVFDFLASRPRTTIDIHTLAMRLLRWLPERTVAALVDSTMNTQTDAETRQITTQLLRQPAFALNFFALGLEEIRDVPEVFDVSLFVTASLTRIEARRLLVGPM
jgi:pimeloyl-ACP methyl ester carboxylesterase